MQRLEVRWGVRRIRAGVPALGEGLDHPIVVPTDREGRPGYRLIATAPSSGIREPAAGQSTSDFMLKYAPRSYLLGICCGSAGPDDLVPQADETVEGVLAYHRGATCVEAPSATLFAGERAMTYTIGVSGLQVTEWFFNRAGWAFTVGRYHHPADGPEALDTADRIMASWEWLADVAPPGPSPATP